MILDAVTGASHRLLEAPPGSRLFWPVLTRDGRTLYCLRLEEEADLWLGKLHDAR